MPRTYVNNPMNRSLGRVGMAHGTAVHSSSSSYGGGGGSSSSAQRTYADNPMNRSLGRVGMVHGTAVHSANSSNSSRGSASSSRTYVDNAKNRNLGRVGMEHGTAVHSTSSNTSRASNAHHTTKTYADNAYNRRHGRVGKPIGTVAISRNATSSSGKRYVDNSYNRSLGRVGLPLGSMPVSRGSSTGKKARQIYQDIERGQYDMQNINQDYGSEVADYILELVERMRVWETVKKEKHQESQRGFSRSTAFDNYVGDVLEFNDIQLGERIGHGGFGDVFSAYWCNREVAVKKLRVQRVSRKRLEQFEEEINIFSRLFHKNIVKFYGACITTPNICMVMELMRDSLFDIIHVKEIQFDDAKKMFIIREIAEGLNYLHSEGIAHCDIKSTNILMNIFEDGQLVVKLTDFGLSKMKNDTETTTSKHQHLGTPRYSAPEILVGELLSQNQMKKTDVYSYGLVVFEIVCEEEPFEDLNPNQLQKQVGENGLTPPIEKIGDRKIRNLINRCLQRQAKQRPTMNDVLVMLD